VLSSLFKRLLCIGTMLLAFDSSYAQVVYLEDANFDTLKDQARLTGKNIMLVCCTEWCAPCQELKKNHFKDTSVSDVVNNKFVVSYYDMEKGRGLAIGKKYGIREYPTMIFLNAEGRFLKRLEGYYRKVNDFIDALKGVDGLQYDLYPGISTSLNLLFPAFYNHYFESRKKEMVSSDVVDAYLDKQKNLYSEVNWRIMQTLGHGPKYDSFIYNNYPQYVKLYNAEATLKVNRIIIKMLKDITAAHDLNKMEQLIGFMRKNGFSDEIVLERKLSFYGKTGMDWDLFNDLLNEFMTKYNGTVTKFCDDVLSQAFPAKLGHTFLRWIDAKLKTDSSAWLYIYKGLFLEADKQTAEAEKMYNKALESVDTANREVYISLIKNRQKVLHTK